MNGLELYSSFGNSVSRFADTTIMRKQELKQFGINFVVCGMLGWCFEILWTGFGSMFHKNRKLSGQTSLWMFVIYGMAAVIEPVYRRISKEPLWLRGSIYTVCIYTCEYLSGSLLKLLQACPWDYSRCRHHVKGLINLDYAGAWFVMGLLYERFLLLLENLCSNRNN